MPLPPSKYRSRNPVRRLLVRRFLEAVDAEVCRLRPAAVLDAGCGEGHVLTRLPAPRGGPTVGVDISRRALAVAQRQSPRAFLVQADLCRLPFRDRSFPLVCCLEVLEHQDRPEAVLAEISRVSGGYVLLSVPLEPFFRFSNLLVATHLTHWGSDPGHRQTWSRRGFARFLDGRVGILSHRVQYPWQIVLAVPDGFGP